MFFKLYSEQYLYIWPSIIAIWRLKLLSAREILLADDDSVNWLTDCQLSRVMPLNNFYN